MLEASCITSCDPQHDGAVAALSVQQLTQSSHASLGYGFKTSELDELGDSSEDSEVMKLSVDKMFDWLEPSMA